MSAQYKFSSGELKMNNMERKLALIHKDKQ